MSMKVGSAGDGEPMMEINTTPLIDVMLVLLIMLIITIPIQTHAVKLDMPRPNTNNEQTVKPEVIDLIIDFDGTVSWNGTVVPNMDTVNSYLEQAAEKDPQPELHLRPSKLAKYKYVAQVMASAQRLGLMKIGIVGNEQFLND